MAGMPARIWKKKERKEINFKVDLAKK